MVLALDGNGNGAGRQVDRGPIMAGLLATLAAVAVGGFGQGAGDFNFYGSAETGALVDFFGHVSRPCFWFLY